MLARKVIVRNQAAAIGVRFQRLAEKHAIKRILIDIFAQFSSKFRQQPHPGIQIRSTIVAMHHGNGLARRRGNHIDFPVYFAQGLFQHDHGKDGCARGNVTRALRHTIGGGHARARVAFGRTQGNAGQKIAFRVQQPRALRGQRARIIPGNQGFR